MRIRKLDLQGFKSFADRASFHFGAGISGVVGPNGCGKSNVIDAVKWCLGEQSAKSLRGDSMADVIFAGSAGRSPVGFAEVSLTFEAGAEPFPGVWQRFAELEVTRRLYRDGHSEYRVNQDRVRLRDIQDLFMDTGVGNQLYSVIEQGRIGQIVHARPEQRRTLIEEAAGISRYKIRREETLEKLNATRTALERVSDLAEELGRQLKAAERQVVRVGRWRAWTARVRQEEIALGLMRCAGLLGDRKALSERQRALEADVAEATRAVERHEMEAASRREALDALEEEANRVRDKLAEVETARRVEESGAAFREKEAKATAERLARLSIDQAEARRERDAGLQEGQGATARGDEAERALARCRAAAELAGGEARVAGEGVAAARAGLDAARKTSQAAYQAAAQAKGRLATTEARTTDLEGRAARHRAALAVAVEGHLDDELARVRGDVAAAEKVAEAARAAVTAAETEAKRGKERRSNEARLASEAAAAAGKRAVDAAQAEAKQAVEGASAALQRALEAAQGAARAAGEAARVEEGARRAAREKAAAALKAAESSVAAAVRERDRVRVRIETIEDLLRRNADAPDGVKAALAVPGVLGMLGAMLDVPEEEEALLARALEGALEAVLVPDAATAARVAGAVGKGRARVFVVPDVPVTGPAARVGGAEPARKALAALLGDVEIVVTVTEAYAAWAPGRRVVTRDGALLRGDGILIVGADAGAGTAALRHRRELAALRDDLEKAEALLTAATASRDVAAVAVEEADRAVAEASRAVEAARQAGLVEIERVRGEGTAAVEKARAAGAQAVDAARTAAVADQERVRKEHAALTEAADAQSGAAMDAARVEQRTRETALTEVRHRLRELEGERLRADKARQALLAEGAALDAERARLAAEAKAAQVALADADARHQAAEDEVRVRLGELERLEPALADASDRAQRARVEAAGLQKDLEAARATAAAAKERTERAAQRSTLIERERSDLEARQVTAGQEAVEGARRLQELGEAQGRVREELERLRERLKVDRERAKAVEDAARVARDRRDGLHRKLVEVEGKLAEVRGSLERIRGDVEGRHEISLPALLDRLDRDGQLLLPGHTPESDALGAEEVPTLRLSVSDLDGDAESRAAALQPLREQLAKLGEVNPAAEEEWREARDRHAEIEKQRADLAEAMDIIEKAIAKINRTCRDRFRETFDLVAGHFAELYPRLVGGGSGRLQLTDEEDLLTCGVEIAVQPPGKRIQNLSLLSGGEKAMAAIGLIFSLFRVKPSPFCLLDEVDAPLDEGNGARFNETLKEMSALSQFIVITHNKKTMECADVLYGVTMPDPGISRVVTVRID